MNAPAKYATKRRPDRRTDGGQIDVLSASLGKPLMPWQREVVDVATERDELGRLVYEIVIVTVPRQSGKTTLLGPVMLHRALINPTRRIFYTAQTQKDANSRMTDVMTLLKGSPLDAPIATYQRSPGTFGIKLPNDAVVRTFAPVESALHGETPPLVVLDEFWEYDEVLGDNLLEQAIRAAQLQLGGNRQVWLVSTAGTAASTFMRKWVDKGRETVKSGGTKWPRIAFFEWSLLEGDDPYDPDALTRFHPAIGNKINGVDFTAQSLLDVSDMSRAAWMRGICNTWTEATDPLVDEETYQALLRDPLGVPSRRELTITYEVAIENAGGVVAATWNDDEGAPCQRVLHAAPGTAWMAGYLADVYRTWQPARFGADDGGSTRWLTDELRLELGDDAVETLGARDFGTACESWLQAVYDRELKLDASHAFKVGLDHLVLTRRMDIVRFGRRESTGPIAGPIAGAVGLRLHTFADGPGEELTIAT